MRHLALEVEGGALSGHQPQPHCVIHFPPTPHPLPLPLHSLPLPHHTLLHSSTHCPTPSPTALPFNTPPCTLSLPLHPLPSLSSQGLSLTPSHTILGTGKGQVCLPQEVTDCSKHRTEVTHLLRYPLSLSNKTVEKREGAVNACMHACMWLPLLCWCLECYWHLSVTTHLLGAGRSQ